MMEVFLNLAKKNMTTEESMKAFWDAQDRQLIHLTARVELEKVERLLKEVMARVTGAISRTRLRASCCMLAKSDH